VGVVENWPGSLQIWHSKGEEKDSVWCTLSQPAATEHQRFRVFKPTLRFQDRSKTKISVLLGVARLGPNSFFRVSFFFHSTLSKWALLIIYEKLSFARETVVRFFNEPRSSCKNLTRVFSSSSEWVCFHVCSTQGISSWGPPDSSVRDIRYFVRGRRINFSRSFLITWKSSKKISYERKSSRWNWSDSGSDYGENWWETRWLFFLHVAIHCIVYNPGSFVDGEINSVCSMRPTEFATRRFSPFQHKWLHMSGCQWFSPTGLGMYLSLFPPLSLCISCVPFLTPPSLLASRIYDH